MMGGHVAQSVQHSVSLEDAKKAAAPAHCRSSQEQLADGGGHRRSGGPPGVFRKMDGTQTGSVTVAIAKARSAALFKRSTKTFQDTLAGGGEGLRVLKLENAVPVEGGLPLIVDGKIVGAIGLSGGTSQQDGQCAQAGVNALQ
jgi:uncharacterized protein GlcG (DUF336 family)